MTEHSAAVGLDALVFDESGQRLEPVTPADWDEWVAASKTRAWCEDDPLLDWLNRFGREAGFVPDTELEDYDPRTDLQARVLERGRLFEEAVVGLIAERVTVVRVASGWSDARDLTKAQETFELMREGVPVITQGVLRNPENRTYGTADLLMRSDVLVDLFPDCLTEGQASIGAAALGDVAWHYRVVDVKFHTLDLLRDGHGGRALLPFMAQVWLYNAALARIQGYLPSASFLLGRSWKSSDQRGDGCLDRLARVDHGHLLQRSGQSLEWIASGAVSWIRRMRVDGVSWRVLPEPSVPELYPHMRNSEDQPWHGAKLYIGSELRELTLLPGMNPSRRRASHATGIFGWDDPRASAANLGVEQRTYAKKCDAVLAANRSSSGPAVLPEQINRAGHLWRQPFGLELFVDFETVSNLNDDFSRMPSTGGQPLIFQIGCGWRGQGEWCFAQWTADRLTEEGEAGVIDGWLSHIDRLLNTSDVERHELRIFHWSSAENASYSTAYNAARVRHPAKPWPDLPWFDVLEHVIRAEPVSVRGAFGFGLKAIAKGMHAAGLIPTTWQDGPTDGLGAMAGAWWCDSEAARTGKRLIDLHLMQEIGRYNEVDCRAMAEVVDWLRRNR